MTFVTFPYAAVGTLIVGFIGLIITIIGVTWKLSKLLAPIPGIEHGIQDLNTRVGIQNGRVTRLEEWKVDHSITAEKMKEQLIQIIRENNQIRNR